ncbi:acetyltransferase [Streptomyces sp. NPDC093149]|uniref:acetyltransferase n=1 Tax=Streptomyces sp. NPDC093149 TaxID=3366031 RepID=UPI0038114409
MRRWQARTATLAASVGVMALGTMAAPAQAAAADPVGLCGSGYSVIDSHKFQSVSGSVYLLYSASAGKNCVVTIRNTAGKAAYMEAGLQVQNGATQYDSGSFTAYAGPVRLAAGGKCVKWGGMLGSDESWTSGWSHCG